jgi:hypothetical protein
MSFTLAEIWTCDFPATRSQYSAQFNRTPKQKTSDCCFKTIYSIFYFTPFNEGTSSFTIQRRAGQRWSVVTKNWGCNNLMWYTGQGYRTVTNGHGSMVEWCLAGENRRNWDKNLAHCHCCHPSSHITGIWYDIFVKLQLGCHPVAVVQYTFTHKQYTEQHKNFWKSGGRAPSLWVITWHLPYKRGKSTEKPQSG